MRLLQPWVALFPILSACGGHTATLPDLPDPGSASGHVVDDGDEVDHEDDDPQAAFCPPLEAPEGPTVTVGPDDDIQAALDSAEDGTTVLLEDGTYALDGGSLVLAIDAVTLRSASGDREAVVLDGSYISPSILNIFASNVTVADLTVMRSYYHPVHVQPAAGRSIEGVTLYNVQLIDPGQQALKVNQNGERYADHGVLACSRLELTDEGRGQVRDNCYTGGVDVHQAQGWEVRDNWIEGFWCGTGLAEYGIHFWTGSRDTVVERNVLVNNGRGIGFGLNEGGVSRPWPDGPCGGVAAQHYGGIIRNNVVVADSSELFATNDGFDTGIALWSACEAEVLHNTVYSTEPPASSSYEYRFATTSGVVANNIGSHGFSNRDAPEVDVHHNLEGAGADLFQDPGGLDLHLSATAIDAIDAGDPAYAPEVPEDLDGQARDEAPDLGADELALSWRRMP